MTPAWWVVVLNWNGRDDTLACLASLRAVEGEAVGVVCVDNGSDDSSEAAVRAAFPEVDVLQTGANLGFAGGNNAGIVHALARGAQWVVLLNNDATIAPGTIDAFRRAAAEYPQAGVLAGKLFFADPPDLIWFAGQDFDARLGYGGRPFGYRRRDAPEFRVPREVGRAVGALMAVPRDVVEEAGLMDDGLFLYVEDVEWCLRIRAHGRSVRFVPDAVAWHLVSASSGGERGSTHTMYYGVRNTILVTERHAPLGRVRTWMRRLLVFGLYGGHAILWSEHRRAGCAAVAAGFRDALTGRRGPRPTK